MTTLESEIIADLENELKATGENPPRVVLDSKVAAAYREVKRARNYPAYYTNRQKAEDMENFYSNVRSIALYDYNMIGVEGQSSSSENGVSRSCIDRNGLFAGIVPLSRV